ncbi:nucleoside-diphosphate sugar epimerase [Labilibacter sediminis]|nr:nucleoside-diphosphate sugar epimerase [Labilibacter sediminis]
MKNKVAIILGASGLTGNLLLKLLIDDERYSSIKLFSRKSVKSTSLKVKEYIGDIIELDQFKSDFTGDEVFCCIGTTKAKTKDQSVYKSIDYGIPDKAATLAKLNGIDTFSVVSAIGANPQSNVFYSRIKGKMEQAVLSQGIKNTYILRPSLIIGNRSEGRLGEDIASIVMKLLKPIMCGSLKKYRPIEANKIAICMHKLANAKHESRIIESNEIKNIVTT